jgi:hypothetical protein
MWNLEIQKKFRKKWDVQHWGFSRFFETARTARHYIRLFPKSDPNPQSWTSHFTENIFLNILKKNLFEFSMKTRSVAKRSEAKRSKAFGEYISTFKNYDLDRVCDHPIDNFNLIFTCIA